MKTYITLTNPEHIKLWKKLGRKKSKFINLVFDDLLKEGNGDLPLWLKSNLNMTIEKEVLENILKNAHSQYKSINFVESEHLKSNFKTNPIIKENLVIEEEKVEKKVEQVNPIKETISEEQEIDIDNTSSTLNPDDVDMTLNALEAMGFNL